MRKICPLLLAGWISDWKTMDNAGVPGRDGSANAKYVECLEDECAWFSEAKNRCALKEIARMVPNLCKRGVNTLGGGTPWVTDPALNGRKRPGIR